MISRQGSHHVAAECDRLVALADAMPAVAERRRAIAGAWYTQLLEETQAPTLESPRGERTLDELVLQLRRAWMATAHEHADETYRSPHAGEAKTLPSHTPLAYSYERGLETNPLELRLPAYRSVPPGWSARHLLFSSGMAALSGIMQMLPGVLGRREDPLLIAAAAYFESRELLLLGTHGCRTLFANDEAGFARVCDDRPPDAVFVEPIVYDPWLRPFDVHRAVRELARRPAPPVVVIDSTLVGPSLPIARMLDEAPSLPLVVQASSGLKLDQAGLELANVGIVSLYAPCAREELLDDAFARLRLVRRLSGTSLTVDTLALLDIPFFLDPAAFHDYANAVFAHNARLARAVPAGGLFEAVAHPALDARGLPWAQAPFVFFHLRDDAPERYHLLERLVVEEARARGLALERGGSFGFRGHRCEAVVLEGQARNGVFKVALGARSGPSLDGIVALLAEIAAFPSVASAKAAFAPGRARD